ncbi:unnamed protein product [Agarophyton chilense]
MPSKPERPLLRAMAKEAAAQFENSFDEQWKTILRTTQQKNLQRKQSSSTNRILDSRIGENDPNLDDQWRSLFGLQR